MSPKKAKIRLRELDPMISRTKVIGLNATKMKSLISSESSMKNQKGNKPHNVFNIHQNLDFSYNLEHVYVSQRYKEYRLLTLNERLKTSHHK